ncbi:MAG: riboflavin synthase [Gammaproteobacteria bacterium]|nr:riboflavin synthase [Gammaproteobacteria bacterium]
MFTGIVTAMGRIAAVQRAGPGVRLHITAPKLVLGDGMIGESIAVSGVCLTAVAIDADGFAADVSPETLACTTLGARKVGDDVNLERALRLADRLGGHLVTGHVDGVAVVHRMVPDGDCLRLELDVPVALQRYVARKGSICIDGVSLTVNAVDRNRVGMQIVPHTCAVTTIGAYRDGTPVNVEVDLVARYLERMLPDVGSAESPVQGTAIDVDLLRRTGFIA